jgi:ATP-dependent DNA helicase RecG
LAALPSQGMLELETQVQALKGVRPSVAEALAAKGISTVEDLLYYLPFRYEDRVDPRSISELRPGEMASVIAEVRSSGLFRTRRMPIFQMTAGQIETAAPILKVKTPAAEIDAPMFRAGAMRSRPTLKCLWFNGTYLRDRFKPGQIVALYGKVEPDTRGRGLQIIQPQFEILSDPGDEAMRDGSAATAESLEFGRIVPIYESAGQGKLTSRWFRRLIHGLLENLPSTLEDAIPAAVRQRMNLEPRRGAFQRVHWPDAGESLDMLLGSRSPAHRRLIFEELFFLELGLELKRKRLRAQPGIAFQLDDRVRTALKRILPFHPTAAQKRVLREIATDMAQGSPMRRLLQGDVGSGKTIVALQAAIIAMENGHQVALMAPTEILATQHYLSARRILETAGYRVVLLTGSLEQDRKRDIRRHVAQGNAQLVIGTHALIEEKVEFAKLGLVIVDEQHRFGVMQRFRLMKKAPAGQPGEMGTSVRRQQERALMTEAEDPDVLVMTATPIPRTLALTIYGDLDVSVLDELPPGRTPIVTRRVSDERAEEVWAFLRKQVAAGHQAYVVYPVIEGRDDEQPEIDFALAASAEGKGSDKKRTASGLKAAEQMYEKLRKKILPDLRVGLLHGRLDADEKDEVMRRFQRHEVDVLVSTTVIEVGVDVANATVMIVEHAERFGLAQMHQLRGRIGRGSARSYCVLMTGGKVSPEAELRLDAMVRTSDGFEIAELDLELRGPGEVFGTRQAGLPSFRVANLLRDRDLLEQAKREAAAVLAGPSEEVSQEEISLALRHLRRHWQRRYGLVEVG